MKIEKSRPDLIEITECAIELMLVDLFDPELKLTIDEICQEITGKIFELNGCVNPFERLINKNISPETLKFYRQYVAYENCKQAQLQYKKASLV